MKYLKIQPDRGARIGHQTDEYFRILKFCREHQIRLLYSPFEGNARNWDSVLNFDSLHPNIDVSNFDKQNIQSLEEVLAFDQNKDMVFEADLQNNQELALSLPRRNLQSVYNLHRDKLFYYYQKNNPYKTNNNIAIHIRRGNLPGSDNRSLELDYYFNIANNICEINPEVQFNLYILSEKNLENTDIFDKFNPVVLKDTSDIDAFYYMVNSDHLICSLSGFSHLAHILGHSKCYYPAQTWSEYRVDAIPCAPNGNVLDLTFINEYDKPILKNPELLEVVAANLFINENDTVLELGGRCGTVSCYINRKLKNKQNHVVVEPDTLAHKCLEANKNTHNAEFIIIKGIVSEETQQYLTQKGLGSYTSADGEKSIETYRLSQIQKNYNLKFDVLVADCEGCLCDFMEHYFEYLEQFHAIIYEIDNPTLCNYSNIKNILLQNKFINVSYHPKVQIWNKQTF